MKPLVVVVLLLASVADAAVLCARARDGVIREGNVRVRLEACRWYERPVGTIDGQPAAVQGPPGPAGEPGPQGEPGPAGADAPAGLAPFSAPFVPVPLGATLASACEAVAPAIFLQGKHRLTSATFTDGGFVTNAEGYFAHCLLLR